jgi:UDP-4-amino-4,6-dideoxy-N-acetyl-beta-L-altrosamine transaminase
VEAVVRVLRSPFLTQGPAIAAFEKTVADYVGARYAVAVASGTAALHLACLAAGLSSRDAGVTSPITFLATANAVVYAGAQPLFSDVDDATTNLDPAALESTLKKHRNVRAVLPVHFAGAPCDMPAIATMARKAGAVVIEDAAHALGATYPGGGRVGNCAFSDMTIFSFHPVKLVAAGEGGMIVTNRPELHEKLLRLRNHGIYKGETDNRSREMAFTDGKINPWYYEMQDLGFHYRMTDLQAALGQSQMRKIDRFLDRRRALVARYDDAFAGLKFARPIQRSLRGESAHHLYVLRCDFARLRRSRADVMGALKTMGVGTQVHYIPVHRQPFYSKFGFKPDDFPNAEKFYEEALSLPLYPGLSDAEQDRVIRAVTQVFGGLR